MGRNIETRGRGVRQRSPESSPVPNGQQDGDSVLQGGGTIPYNSALSIATKSAGRWFYGRMSDVSL